MHFKLLKSFTLYDNFHVNCYLLEQERELINESNFNRWMWPCGSHVYVELQKLNAEVIILDNLSNFNIDEVSNIQDIITNNVNFLQVDIRDREQVAQVFQNFKPDVVLHSAGLKSVSERILRSFEYYNVNIVGGMSILNAMDKCGCEKI